MTDGRTAGALARDGPHARADRAGDRELVGRALASLGLGSGKAARLLGTDVRNVKRIRAGARDPLPEQWRTLAAALEARALYERHARSLAAACRRRAEE
jgi:hypothetical protein